MKNLLPLIIIIHLLSTPVLAQTNTHSIKDSLLKEWEKLELFKDMARKEVPDFGFYAALIWDGKIISAKKMGYANRETKLPLDENTIFMWGSISKMFTSIAVIQLVEKNKLDLNDPIIKYIPELGKGIDSLGGMQAIKIHHLLNHDSGISLRPCYDSLKKVFPRFKYTIPKTKEIKPFLKYTTQKFKPGSKWNYSNGGYSLLGVVVKRITKTKFTHYVTKNIFKPLGMKTAHYSVTPKQLSKYFTRSYFRTKTGKLDTMNFDVSQGFQEGNGGVKATVKDMVKFMDFLKFRKRKAYLKRYDNVLPRKVIDKYYFDVDVSHPNSNKFSVTYEDKEVIVYRFSGFAQVKSKDFTSSTTGHSGSIAFHTAYFYFNNEKPFGIIEICNVNAVRRRYKESRMKSKLSVAIRDFPLFLGFGKKLYTWQKK